MNAIFYLLRTGWRDDLRLRRLATSVGCRGAFSWFGRNRRIAKDYENLAKTLAAFVTLHPDRGPATRAIVAFESGSNQLQIPCFNLTRLGKELLSLLTALSAMHNMSKNSSTS